MRNMKGGGGGVATLALSYYPPFFSCISLDFYTMDAFLRVANAICIPGGHCNTHKSHEHAVIRAYWYLASETLPFNFQPHSKNSSNPVSSEFTETLPLLLSSEERTGPFFQPSEIL